MSEVVEFIKVEKRQLGGTWTVVDRITTADLPVTDGVDTFRKVASSRGNIAASRTEEREELGVVLPVSDAVSQLWLPRSPDYGIRFTIRRATTIDRAPTVITVASSTIVYQGTVQGARFTGGVCEFKLSPPHRALDEKGPRQRYQRNCRWDLYGAGCTLDSATFEVAGSAEVSGDPSPLNFVDYVFSTDFGAPLDNGYLAGGHIILKGQYVRQISHHNALAATPYVRLTNPFPVDVEDADAFQAYPGCKHTSDDCLNKFNNIDNFGGFARVAKDNPFRKSIRGGVG